MSNAESQTTDKARIAGPKKVGKINLKNLRPKQKDDSSLDNIQEIDSKDGHEKVRANCSPAPKIAFRQEVTTPSLCWDYNLH